MDGENQLGKWYDDITSHIAVSGCRVEGFNEHKKKIAICDLRSHCIVGPLCRKIKNVAWQQIADAICDMR